MATLSISTFLSIESAVLELKRLTVFIGPQAQGKSVVLKLAYFFERVLEKALIDLVTAEITPSAFAKDALDQFQSYFPKYAWGTSAFHVSYREGDFEITISRDGGRTNNPARIVLGENLLAATREANKRFRAELEERPVQRRASASSRRRALDEAIAQDASLRALRVEPTFIPASRSFFANIERNIFALMSSKFELDLLMAEFGTLLESTRRDMLMYSNIKAPASARRKRLLRKSEWAPIIGGDYVFDGDQETIEHERRIVRIANSSSGQQEVIPLLLVLDHFSSEDGFIFGPSRRHQAASFFVEEPEAHLFPQAQKAVASLLTSAMNRNPVNRVMFTTHSPYMLTAINNLHLAGKLHRELDGTKRKQLSRIATEEQSIAPDELAAFKVDKGRVTSIVDRDTGLVNGMLIDEVSIEFAQDFDKLLALDPSTSGE